MKKHKKIKSKEINKIVDDKIRDHETRVAIVSSIIGVLILTGLAHAIHLNHVLLISGSR